MKEQIKCVFCGESKEAIRRHKLICCEGDMPRHRFKPFTEKELKEAIEQEEYFDSCIL